MTPCEDCIIAYNVHSKEEDRAMRTVLAEVIRSVQFSSEKVGIVRIIGFLKNDELKTRTVVENSREDIKKK